MLSEFDDAHAVDDAAHALDRVLAAFASLGYPEEVVAQWSIPRPDAIDLVRGLRRDLQGVGAPRILEVGTFVGTSALVMLLTLPRAVVHSVDPNFALEVEFDAMHCAYRDANLARTTQEVAALAAEKLGVRDRLVLHEGGYSTAVTFAGRARNTHAIGGAILAEHGPFDCAFIDGLHFEETVLSDALLAARSIKPSGSIYLHDAIGYWGSSVRRALNRFLEVEPSFTLAHAPYADLYRSVARVSRVGSAADSMDDRLTRCFGASADRFAECVARAITTSLPPLDAKSLDVFSVATSKAIGVHEGEPVCGVLLGGVDDLTSADSLQRVREACVSCDALLLGCTAAGEQGAAGQWSQPLATRLAQLAALGFDVFDVVTPFLEAFSYALGNGCILPRSTSFLLNSVVAVRRASALHASVIARGHTPLTSASARSLESARTQQVHDHAALRASQSQEMSSRERARMHSEQNQLLMGENGTLSNQIENLTPRLQYYLDWRIHIGRHHALRKRES